MENKYLLISKRFSVLKRGAFKSSEYFKDNFEDNIDFIESSKIVDYIDLNEKYKRLIFLTQAPHLYNKKITFITANKLNSINFLRPEYISEYNNSATNCFHLYKEYKKYKFYIPIIFSNRINVIKEDKIVLGIYFRNNIICEDSCKYLKHLLNNIKYDLDLYILGSSSIIIKNKKIKSIKFTTNPQEFYSKITHFIYPESNMIDPFPQSILEAVHNNCQIIIPKNRTKNFKDGIDDIKSLIKYHEDINFNKFYDNTNCILTFDNLKKFYNKLFNNNFEFNFIRDKYLNIKDFIDDII